MRLVNLQATTDKSEADKLLNEVISKVDKLAKKNIIHKNKANRIKSRLAKHISSL